MGDHIEQEIKHPQRLGLFEGYGVELEYMIVDRDSLDVKPIVDELIKDQAGSYVNEVERGTIAWSNELVLHVLELKTNGPAECLEGLAEQFQQEIRDVNHRLEKYNARLMPTAMHPWMDPETEMKLWPHEYNPIYEAYNRIFDCRGHGWANLQSTHINLPFASDREFEKLHAAIRLVLPILPAIAASSPLADLKLQGFSDYRLEVYRTNSQRIPSVTGHIVPEPVFSYKDYNDQIFQRIYRDIAPYDPDDILQEEWLNSRGAIARFDRGSIEIRVLDIQECPQADLAILRLICDTLKSLTDEQRSSLEDQKSWNEKELYRLLLNVMKDGEAAVIENRSYAELFGLSTDNCTAGELWKHIFKELYSSQQVAKDSTLQTMQQMLELGTLSGRITNALQEEVSRARVQDLYQTLCNCLQEGKLFRG